MSEKEQNTDSQSKDIPQGKQNESAQRGQQGQQQSQKQKNQTNPVPDYPDPEPNQKKQQPTQKEQSGFVKRISSKKGILSALTALLLVLSVPAIVAAAGLGAISLSVVTQGWFMMYSTMALMGAVRLFGKDTLQSVREAQGGE